MKHFTVGEILRQGLLKNHRGYAYKHKATILKIVGKLRIRRIETPYGPGYAVPQSEIDRHNRIMHGFES